MRIDEIKSRYVFLKDVRACSPLIETSQSASRCSIYNISIILILCIILTVQGVESVIAQTPNPRHIFSIESFYQDKFLSPVGIFVDKEKDEVYVADSKRSEIYIFDSRGTPVFRFGKSSGIAIPLDIAVRNGNIYVSQEGKKYLEIFNYRGQSIGRIAPDNMDFLPGRMALDEEKRLYVVNKAGSECLIFDSGNQLIGSIGKGIKSLSGVGVSKDRVYLITPFQGKSINIYNKSGTWIDSFEGTHEGGGSLGLPVTGIVDGLNNLWVVDQLGGIVIYNAENSIIGRVGGADDPGRQLIFPIDIDFGLDNMVYIVEKNGKRVSVFKFD